MSAFHYLIDVRYILIFFALASRTQLIASWHHEASCSTSFSVHSAYSWALSFASSIHCFSAASASFSVIAAKFHPSTLSWSPSSWLSTPTSHSITSWSDPVAWSSASMVHFTIGRFASIRSMTDSPSWPSLVQWWVGLPLFLISSPFWSITSSQNAAFRSTWHLRSHRLLWALKSPVRMVLRHWMTLCQFNIRAGLSLSPGCASR